MKTKNKILYLILASLALLSLLIVALTPKNDSDSPSPSYVPNSEEIVFPTRSLTPGEIASSTREVSRLQNSLPIYIENFQTSANITTTINIFTLDQDPDHFLHLDIYGIQYQNQNPNPSSNPNALAFKESFEEVKKRLYELNIDPNNLYFIFGSQKYIQDTSLYWIEEMNLLSN